MPKRPKTLHSLPYEWFGDEPTGASADSLDLMTPEQMYSLSLRMGFRRDKSVEDRLDMSQVDLPTKLENDAK